MISFFIHSGGAGKIRGEQIAKHIGAKLNPKEGYENDVCIYVKSVPPENYPKRTYIDVVEDSAGLRWVRQHPTVSIIASSVSIYEHLKGILSNYMVLIPQHHCNFKNELREQKEVKTVGIIGNKASFQYPLEKLEKKLDKIGVRLLTHIQKTFKGREEVVDFYKKIDIQLVWRPNSDGVLRNPLKLINASSFGIPTVAYPETNFVKEFGGYFLETLSIDEMVLQVEKLKENISLYEGLSINCVAKAKDYHIENISKLYLDL